jgi:hypothetical protein
MAGSGVKPISRSAIERSLFAERLAALDPLLPFKLAQ